jgi:hypothetical protein
MELRSSARCNICHEDGNNSVSPNSCEHRFCLPCLRRWARASGDCPICRRLFDSIVTRDGCTAVACAAQVDVRIISDESGHLLEVLPVHAAWLWAEMVAILTGHEHKVARAMLAQSRQ